jgi:SAM-dependent methyltransferase
MMSGAVHPTAQAGWDGEGADDYERGRPGYPRAAIELIGSEFAIGREGPNRILDLAAGTGKLTRELPILGAEVIAVEPVAGMRERFAAAVPGIELLAGSAEAIPLPDAVVHVVTVAQAFHWFDVPVAAAEIARVLDPTGGLAIFRNEWFDGAEQPWAAELSDYIDAAARKPETHGRDWRGELDATGVFAPFVERVVVNDQRGELATLLHRVASMSFVAARPEAERTRLVEGADALLRGQGLEPGQEITIPTRTIVRWARKRPR